MNLEAIEQKCLHYLMQVSRPLVPLDQLLRHLQRDPEFLSLSEHDLLTFLREHELFVVLDPIGIAGDPDGRAALAEAGISTSPSVILETRIPPQRELSEQMIAQLETLMDSLDTARREAYKTRDAKKVSFIDALLERASGLLDRLKNLG